MSFRHIPNMMKAGYVTSDTLSQQKALSYQMRLIALSNTVKEDMTPGGGGWRLCLIHAEAETWLLPTGSESKLASTGTENVYKIQSA